MRLAAFRKFLLPRVFQVIPPLLAAGICLVLGVVLAGCLRFKTSGIEVGGGAAAALLAATFAIHLASKRAITQAALALAEAVVKADRTYEAVRVAGTQAHDKAQQAIQAEYERTHRGDCRPMEPGGRDRDAGPGPGPGEGRKPDAAGAGENPGAGDAAVGAAGGARGSARLARIKRGFAARREEAVRKHEAESQQWKHEQIEEWQTLEQQWKAEIEPIYAEIREIQAEGEALFPAWSEEWIESWKPPREFPVRREVRGARGGREDAGRRAAEGSAAGAAGPGGVFAAAGAELPAAGIAPDRREGIRPAGGDDATLNALVLRLLAASPPGKASFTIIDPVGLGENFAGLMYLADYEESLINRRIWTQQGQIEERLAELNEHIEKVIQMYLRNEYATITEYNEKAGSVAEKYHFLVIADFPAQFSETAARRLQSIAASGPRCGVFTLIQWDQRQTPPEGLATEELRRSSVCVQRRAEGYFLPGFQPEPGPSWCSKRRRSRSWRRSWSTRPARAASTRTGSRCRSRRSRRRRARCGRTTRRRR